MNKYKDIDSILQGGEVYKIDLKNLSVNPLLEN